MNLKIIKNKNSTYIVKTLTYVIAIIMIVNCNSVFVTGLYSSLVNKFNLFLMFISVCYLIYINKSSNINLSKYIVIVSCLLIYVLLFLVLQRNSSALKEGLNDLIKLLIMFSLVYMVYKTTRYPSLLAAYCNVVVLIATVSLFFWVIGSNWHLINPTSTYISNWSTNGSRVMLPSYYNLYFESQRLGNTIRNSAIFAEAPMASLTFSIALCLEAIYQDTDRFYILKLLILSFAIISTLSTTGYICLILVLGYKLITKKYSNNYVNMLKIIIIPLMLIIGIIGIHQFLTQKLGTSSGISRSQDYLKCFRVWKQYPFLGAGIGAGQNDLVIREIKMGSFGYSNSFGKVLAENGLYIFSLYFIGIFRSIYISLKCGDFSRLFLTAILIYLFVTTMWVNTYTMLFLFSLIAVWQPNTDVENI